MPWTLEQLAASITNRGQFTGSGIGFAGGYIATLAESLGTAGLAGHLKLTRDQLNKAIKDASTKLVWRDPGAEITAAAVKGESGLVFQGKSARPDAEFKAIKSSSLMEFENILTTGDTDRDGDDLAPKGAEVDPRAPLLWQHLPNEPIGKMFKVLEQSDKLVKTHCGIADTPLGHDAAVLVDYGALRISHGFKPKEFEPKNHKDNGEDGWNILKYEVMEVSLVSIPANTGAIITALEKGKLGTALVKGYAGALNAGRAKMLTGGWSAPAKTEPTTEKTTDTTAAGIHVHVHLNNGTPAGVKGKKDEETDGGGTTDPKTKPEDSDTPTEDADESAEKGMAGLKDILDAMKALSKDKNLPDEARARAGLVLSMLNDVSGTMGEAMKQLAQAGKDMDIAGAASGVQEMVAGGYLKLQRALEEVQRVCEVEGLPESAAKQLQDAHEGLGAITAALAELGGMKDDSGDGLGAEDEVTTGGDPEGEVETEDDEADEQDAYAGLDTDPDQDNEVETEDDEDSDGKGFDEVPADGNCPECHVPLRQSQSYGGKMTCPDCGEMFNKPKSEDAETPEDGKDGDEEEPATEKSLMCQDCGEEFAEPRDPNTPFSAIACPHCGGKRLRLRGADEDETEEKAESDVSGGEANPEAEVDPEEDNPGVDAGKAANAAARKMIADLEPGVKLTSGLLRAINTITGATLKARRKTAAV